MITSSLANINSKRAAFLEEHGLDGQYRLDGALVLSPRESENIDIRCAGCGITHAEHQVLGQGKAWFTQFLELPQQPVLCGTCVMVFARAGIHLVPGTAVEDEDEIEVDGSTVSVGSLAFNWS